MDAPHAALARAVELADGQLALAKKIGTTQSNVWTWLHKSKRGAPAGYVLPIERATGVSRHELRPDIYPPEEAGARPAVAAEEPPQHEAADVSSGPLSHEVPLALRRPDNTGLQPGATGSQSR